MPSQKIPLKTAKNNPNFNAVFDVDPEEVLALKDQLTLIDVRRPEELQSELSHIEGVTHIVLDELGSRTEDVPKDGTVIFVCRSGARSASATDFFQSLGYKNVYNMGGGMIRWNELNLPTARKS